MNSHCALIASLAEFELPRLIVSVLGIEHLYHVSVAAHDKFVIARN